MLNIDIKKLYQKRTEHTCHFLKECYASKKLQLELKTHWVLSHSCDSPCPLWETPSSRIYSSSSNKLAHLTSKTSPVPPGTILILPIIQLVTLHLYLNYHVANTHVVLDQGLCLAVKQNQVLHSKLKISRFYIQRHFLCSLFSDV